MNSRSGVLAVISILLALPSIGGAQSKEFLVGTWKLVSVSNTTNDGAVQKDVFGKNPTGFLTYTADDRMMAIAASDGRKPLLLADWYAGPIEKRAEAFSTLFAYAGRYTVAGNKVIHHVEVAWIQSFVNTDLVRLMHLEGEQLVLRTTPFQRDGVQYAYQDLVWKRVK